VRIRLDIAYDGTHFRGWARQPGLRTVQETLESALGRVLGGDPRLVVAGRTDAGVHASGQVAHVDLDEAQDARLLARHPRAGETSPLEDRVTALAARMTGVVGAYSDVAVTRSVEAAPGFDARFTALWRRYEYRIADSVTGYDPLERHRTTSVRASLDHEAMDAAARALIGLHDFAAYCKPREEATTIRTLLEFDWHRDDAGVLVANVKADAFCHSMVRALVGCLLAIGDGRRPVAWAGEVLRAATRNPAVTVAHAHGLTLEQVAYPADLDLAQRAVVTRARRVATGSAGSADDEVDGDG